MRFFYCCGAGAGAGAAFLDYYGAGVSAGAVFCNLFLCIRGAGAVFLKIFDCGCETAPAPALRSLVTPRLMISVKSGDTNNQIEVSPKTNL